MNTVAVKSEKTVYTGATNKGTNWGQSFII